MSLPVSLPMSRFGAFRQPSGSPMAPAQKGKRQTGKRLVPTRVPLSGPPLPRIRAPCSAPRIGLEISVLRAPIFAAVHPFPNRFGAVRGGSDALRPVPVPAFRVQPSGCAPQHRGGEVDEGGSEDIDSLHFEISLRGAGAGAFSGAPEG